MRCPKCHYLSFEPEARCKNCGYSFSLADVDLAARADPGPEAPLDDLVLRPPGEAIAPPLVPDRPLKKEPARRRPRESAVRAIEPDPDPVTVEVAPAPSLDPIVSPLPVSAPPRRAAPGPRPIVPPTTELPLFVKGLPSASDPAESDEPFVRVPSEPRAPLAVRRPAPEVSPVRAAPATRATSRKLGPLDRDLLDDLQRIEKTERRAEGAGTDATAGQRAGAVPRLAAAALDAGLMVGLAALVLGITLRWCDLPVTLGSVGLVWPTGVFVVLMGAWYALMFTAAGGQTLGKMACGLRVVDGSPDETSSPASVSVEHAIWRTLLSVPSVLALGLGFIPALVGDGRAIHDRLAGTRVVRA